jgi:uncharacterized BrkB/YihY/UPF0761 family membrane protein
VDSYKYSFIPRTIVVWNILPVAVIEAVTIEAFKDALGNLEMAPYLRADQQ